MTQLTPRRKIMFGVLAIVVVGWLADTLLNAGRPNTAQAQSGEATQDLEPISVKAAEIAPLIAALGRSAPESPRRVGMTVDRSPFAIPEGLIAIIATKPAETPPKMDLPDEPSPVDAAPFGEVHTLQGIIAGPNPLALIDGVLLARGDHVDGAELIEIRRDRVVFERDDSHITLELSLPGSGR